MDWANRARRCTRRAVLPCGRRRLRRAARPARGRRAGLSTRPRPAPVGHQDGRAAYLTIPPEQSNTLQMGSWVVASKPQQTLPCGQQRPEQSTFGAAQEPHTPPTQLLVQQTESLLQAWPTPVPTQVQVLPEVQDPEQQSLPCWQAACGGRQMLRISWQVPLVQVPWQQSASRAQVSVSAAHWHLNSSGPIGLHLPVQQSASPLQSSVPVAASAQQVPCEPGVTGTPLLWQVPVSHWLLALHEARSGSFLQVNLPVPSAAQAPLQHWTELVQVAPSPEQQIETPSRLVPHCCLPRESAQQAPRPRRGAPAAGRTSGRWLADAIAADRGTAEAGAAVGVVLAGTRGYHAARPGRAGPPVAAGGPGAAGGGRAGGRRRQRVAGRHQEGHRRADGALNQVALSRQGGFGLVELHAAVVVVVEEPVHRAVVAPRPDVVGAVLIGEGEGLER